MLKKIRSLKEQLGAGGAGSQEGREEEEEGEREEGLWRKEEKFLLRRNLLFGGVAPVVPLGGETHWPGSDFVEERECEARERRPPCGD